jgi:hypothetical protein
VQIQIALDEADVRHLCGGAFARADALQRAGHVIQPAVKGTALAGQVRGTWRRIDTVSIDAPGTQIARLTPQCTCGLSRPGAFCRHAGALLLHWVRAAGTFAVDAGDAVTPDGAFALDPDLDLNPDGPFTPATAQAAALSGPPVGPPEEPLQEVAQALEFDVAPHLREIAKRRGVSGGSKTKAELVKNLAAALVDPANLGETLAALAPDERAALDAAYLMAVTERVPTSAIASTYHALVRKTAAPPLDALVDRGLLLLAAPRQAHADPGAVRVPRVVSAHLPVRDGVLRQASPAPRTAPGTRTGEGDGGALAIGETLWLVANELRRGSYFWEPESQHDLQYAAYVPPGWRIDPQVFRGGADLSQLWYGRRDVRLLPQTLAFTGDGAHRLARATGQSRERAMFAVALLNVLGIVGVADIAAAGQGQAATAAPYVDAEQMEAFLALSPGALAAALARAWLSLGAWSELDAVAGAGGPLELRFQMGTYGIWSRDAPQTTSARWLAGRIAALLPAGVWYDAESLADLLRRAAPGLFGQAPSFGGRPIWWVATHQAPQTPIDLRSRAGWQQVCAPLIGRLLAGPLSWMGFVDVATDAAAGRGPHGVPTVLTAFRVRPAAAAFAGREVETEDRPPARLEVSFARAGAPGTASQGRAAATGPGQAGAPLVLVPAGSNDMTAHALLARAGDVAEATAAGVRYRLTARGVQGVLDSGLGAGDLRRFLLDRAAGAVSDEVLVRLDAWCTGYGTTRLYDDLALVEVAEDALLPEILAATSLGAHVLQAFTPRLVAVAPQAVDAVVAELTRLGYAPRVVEHVRAAGASAAAPAGGAV